MSEEEEPVRAGPSAGPSTITPPRSKKHKRECCAVFLTATDPVTHEQYVLLGSLRREVHRTVWADVWNAAAPFLTPASASTRPPYRVAQAVYTALLGMAGTNVEVEDLVQRKGKKYSLPEGYAYVVPVSFQKAQSISEHYNSMYKYCQHVFPRQKIHGSPEILGVPASFLPFVQVKWIELSQALLRGKYRMHGFTEAALQHCLGEGNCE